MEITSVPRSCLVLLLLLLGLLPAAAGAQESEECRLGRISELFIDNRSVFDLSDPDQDDRFQWAFRLANRLHVPTREEVIRRELLFDVGDCLDPALMEESERILRRSAFIARVDIFAVRQPDGSNHVVVDTQDDWSTKVEVQMEQGTGMRPSGFRVGEDNLFGTGRRVSAFYLRSFEERVYGATYLDPQLFGTRWQAGAEAGRTQLGYLFSESLIYPFVGETGRWGVRQEVRHHDRYLEFLSEREEGLVGVLFPERRRGFDLGAAIRRGRPGRLTLLGAMLAGEWISYPGEARLSSDDGTELDSLPSFPGMDSVGSVRAMLLTGRRNVYYVRRRALDSVTGTEDVRLGLEVELGVGRSLAWLSTADDVSLDFGLFGAGEVMPGLLAGTQLRLEGKHEASALAEGDTWRDVFGQFDAWVYLRPSDESRHTWVAALAAAGGWNTRVPFQLTIGGATGLRGYPRHIFPGAQRAVISLEQRSYLGWPFPQLFDLGTVAFVDAGRTWAGDVPFGVDSPVRANVGLGLRGALPPGSPSTFRLDLAAPIQSSLRVSDLVLSLGFGHAIGRQVREDPQLRRSSRSGISTSLFTRPERRDP
ncbi:MAG: BamA/TamA family outer membrane protein [Gemmatimonadota bacterium]|nr:BamA/TamA family outer membrane protein [Gemmatimonadota bacterium]